MFITILLNLRFSSAHVDAYKGHRGTLHGHNYRVKAFSLEIASAEGFFF